MNGKWLALVPCAVACGAVADPKPAVDAAVEPADAAIDAAPPRPFRGTLMETPVVAFGGTPFCNYTITLRQITIEVDVLPGTQVTSGRAQALNVEGVVPPCPHGSIPPTIATYTYQSAKPIQGGQQLTFKGAGTNNPGVNLVVDLSSAGAGFQARMAFHRFDQPAPLDWSVVATLSMSAQ